MSDPEIRADTDAAAANAARILEFFAEVAELSGFRARFGSSEIVSFV